MTVVEIRCPHCKGTHPVLARQGAQAMCPYAGRWYVIEIESTQPALWEETA